MILIYNIKYFSGSCLGQCGHNCAWSCRASPCETSSGCYDHCAGHGGGTMCADGGCNNSCTICVSTCSGWCWNIGAGCGCSG